MSLLATLKNKIYTHLNRNHYQESSAVFDLLYYAKDFDTFYNTALWAREFVNPGIFVQAFATALFHRKDCRNLILPPLYEIFPSMFVQSDVLAYVSQIKEAEGFDEPAKASVYGIEIGKYDNYTIANSFKGVFRYNSDDLKLAYYTQDVGLNLYNYLYFAEYPPYLTQQEYGLSTTVRGELYFYMYQQLIARYQLERLSNNIEKIKIEDLTMPAYNPNMRYHNGFPFPSRPENYSRENCFDTENSELIKKYKVFEEARRNDMKKFVSISTIN